jgi:regulator of sigma E protease
MAVVAAGPISNLLLAVLIYTVIFATGVPMLLAVIGEVQEGFPASQAGLQSGDVIRTIDSHPIEGWDDLTGIIHGSAGRPLNMTVTRGGEELKFQVTPRETLVKNVFGEETPVGLIGISPAGETVTRRYNPLAALGLGVERTWNIIYLTFIGIGKIFQRVVPADTLGGPLMIVQMAGEQAKMGFMNLVFLVAFLSIMLGVFNILPIPVLDGGHLFFFLIEALRGRPLSMKKREIIQQVGLLILISIFLFATFNDVMRIFVK